MAEKNQIEGLKKNPALAAIISAIFPGAGFFYIGNFMKGVAYMIIFAMLIVMEVYSSEYSSRVMEIVVFGLFIAGFYIFQIIDSFNEARVTGLKPETKNGKKMKTEEISLFGSLTVLILGIIFLLINFDILTYRQVIRLWPLFLIGLGIKYIFNYYRKKEEDNEQTQN